MSREYRRGSIVSFIVVGVLLVALVLGGLYLAKNHLGGWINAQKTKPSDDSREIAREEKSDDKKADQAADSNSDADVDKPEPVGDDSGSQSAPASGDKQPVDDDDSDIAADNPTEQSSAEVKSENDNQSSDDSEATDGTIPTTGVSMPQTGLADSLVGALPIAALVVAVVAYRRSNML